MHHISANFIFCILRLKDSSHCNLHFLINSSRWDRTWHALFIFSIIRMHRWNWCRFEVFSEYIHMCYQFILRLYLFVVLVSWYCLRNIELSIVLPLFFVFNFLAAMSSRLKWSTYHQRFICHMLLLCTGVGIDPTPLLHQNCGIPTAASSQKVVPTRIQHWK